ncbi:MULTISPECIES: helix-turn-helix domain-containing protein [Enterococcus]|uniref:HTH cro/C1-type domain-containing protein n=1 Tax=Enterococcus gilvus ATCC BAA-350 TaxID=1158614 RepID=R2VD72_9ENTE|nr:MULTISPECIES: helix-turn-helix transcriptional regulator [Enterococcus]EOI55591.1 hypothetical protein UKC_02800 [Enterococcus gilvus ATCC BAA-350]EOW81866.1 hypothetical protein I592_01166 [Enterococcus gilvus ATCC BAA-350]MDB1750005.1 helix-turn-helix transcriptional regulator [Enterococcus avium]MDB1754054.1 helix-turn-helix transcriptional regulator [Enterococcus avium]MDB1761127.1 helix-turn-helix transcriptional regulator [Enterococcus avium]
MIKQTDLYDTKKIGMRIKSIRNSFGCTMEKFGQLIGGASKTAVNNWEHGSRMPSKEKLELIAIIGRTSISWILYGDFNDYIHSLLKTDSKPYKHMKKFYSGSAEATSFEFYESASQEVKQEIIDNLFEEINENEWCYEDAPHIMDCFVMILTRYTQERELSRNLPIELRKPLHQLKERGLTRGEIKRTLRLIEDYLSS